MNRRDFIRRAAALGALLAVDVKMAGEAFAKKEPVVAKGSAGGVDLVAVMGGEPDVMLQRMLAEMGGISRFVKKGDKVVLKPNIGWDRTPEQGADTNPLLVAAMVKLCLAVGAKEVLAFDHTCNNWQKCYTNSGIEAAVTNAGGKMVPGNDESYYVPVKLPNGVKLKETTIHKVLIDCDVWFNMPVLKHHGGAKMTASMKNYLGIMWNRRVFHDTDLQQCIADVNTWEKKPALHIVDAYRVVKTNGPQGKSPDDVVLLKALFASADPVAVDTASAKFFNQVRSDITLDDVSHIGAGAKLGLGTTNLNAVNVKRITL